VYECFTLFSYFQKRLRSITAVKSYALKIFENAEDSTRFYSVIPWAPIQNPSTIIEAFEAAMSTITRQVNRLIPMIDTNDHLLLKMEDNLLLLQELISREHSSIIGAQSDVVGKFWMRIRRAKKLRQFDHHLRLLIDLEATRNHSAIHIAVVLRILREMKEGMEGISWRCRNASLSCFLWKMPVTS
jgi:hypothetical protein